MTHEEFVRRRKVGVVSAGISESMALKIIDTLPMQYRWDYTLQTWFWASSIPGFLCVSIFIKWWAGILLLLFITPVLFRRAKQTAARCVLAYATDDKEFFEKLVAFDLLMFKDEP